MSRPVAPEVPLAVVGGRLATDLVDVTSDLTCLDGSGFWAVVLPFEGEPVCARFAHVRPARPWPGKPWRGPQPSEWTTSLDADAFQTGVRAIRESIAAGDVYQVNLTRRLSAPFPAGGDVAALGAALAEGNPAPYSAVVRLPHLGCEVASASPERFLRREGSLVRSSPIKGTAPEAAALTAKDRAENVMIVDLVRNDLGRVCEFGSVTVPALLALEAHPGLVHLVSTVEGRLRPGCGWADAIGATFPPGSVTGAPKQAAMEHLAALEPVPRGVYCGAVGWVDADEQVGDLNVAIRTFWVEDGLLHFGTGGGITWDSDPAGEWAETELKARHLLRVRVRILGVTDGLVWCNGSLVAADEATVSVFDHGLTVGDGVFETLKAVHGQPFATRRHLERLRRSADGLGLRVPFDDDALRTAMAEVLASHDQPLARVRVTVTGGAAPLGSERGEGAATVLVAVGPLKEAAPSTSVCTVPWPRNERGAMAGIKTTSYAENVVALAHAKARGATEAIFATTTDLLCEGTGSNVFVGVGGRLLTPPLTSGCLAGVTRDLVLEVTDAVEEDIPMAAFLAADEVFLTSTGRDVQPVHQIDDRPLPVPGPLTEAAARAFRHLESTAIDP